jgi:hypothetical protein
MSDAIQFLASIGRTPLSPLEYEAAVNAQVVDSRQVRALLDRDEASLNELLGGASKMVCAVLAADEDA